MDEWSILGQKLEAQRRQQEALDRYNAAQANLQQAQSYNSGGGLGDVLSNAWNGITSGATGLWDAGAGAVNSLFGGAQTAIHQQDTKNTMADASNQRNEIARKYGFNSYSEAMNSDKASQDFWNEIKAVNSGTMDKLNQSKDSYVNSDIYKNLANMKQNQYAADAIRGENFLADVLTAGAGGGLASAVGINSVQGALGGLADELENSEGMVFDPLGGNYSTGNLDGGKVLNTMLSSAAGGAAGTLAGGKLGKLGGSSNLGKVLSSNVGRGALAGAASGAVSAGTRTALEGGDLGQVLSNAANAGSTGALYGGITSGAMGLANRGFNKLSDAINKEKTPNVLGQEVEPIAKNTNADVIDDGEIATGWGDKNMTGAAKKRNALQKFGDTLQDTGQKTQDQSVIGKLKGNLGEEVTRKDSIQRLREIGFEPSDYEQAANLSEVANKSYADALKATNKKANLPNVYKLSDDIADDLNMSAAQKETLKRDISNRLDAVRKQGGTLYTFDAQGLEDVASALGKKAKKMVTTSEGGSKAANGTLSPDDAKYSQALSEVQKALRGEINDMVGDAGLNKNIASKLKAAGATDKQIEYLTQDGNLSGLKARTSLLEDARNMYRQMKSSPLKRGANADASTNFTTQVANASGLSGLLNMAAEPFGKGVGKLEKGLGKVVAGAGDLVSGNGGKIMPENLSSKISSGVDKFANSAINTTNVANSSAGDLVSALTSATQRNAIRQNAVDQSRQASDNLANQNALQQAEQDVQGAQTEYENAGAQMQQALNNIQTYNSQLSAGQSQLDRIAQGMDRALAAGDLRAYSQLADLYQQAYKIYGAQSAGQGAASSLNATQQGNLAKLESAGSAIDQLEQLYNQAGGGQGRLGGKIAELGANLGMNSAASSYNSAARGLINQIAAAVGKTDSLNTEGEVQRALDLVPKITDTPEEAQIKLQSLRNMLAANKQTYQNIYGVSQ